MTDRRSKMAEIQTEMDRWFSGKQLVRFRHSNAFYYWFKTLERYRDQECKVLEIGSYEGRSAIAFLELLPKCHLTSIDIHARAETEARFDSNMSFYGSRVRKIKSRAAQALDGLLTDQEKFDVILIDTGKKRDFAYLYSTFVWPLLKVGGTLIWDDYGWRPKGKEDDPKAGPGPGIAMFVQQFSPCLQIEHAGKQLIARKSRHWPKFTPASQTLLAQRRGRKKAIDAKA